MAVPAEIWRSLRQPLPNTAFVALVRLSRVCLTCPCRNYTPFHGFSKFDHRQLEGVTGVFSRLKRWITGQAPAPELQAGIDWAKENGAQIKFSVPRDGFVIEMPEMGEGCRLEWGPAQRHYMGARELRLRAATPLDPSVHAAIMTRRLMEGLEREVFNSYLDSAQTKLDGDTPEEMRWLAMSTKLNALQMGPLQTRFGAVCNVPPWCQAWLAGELCAALLNWDAVSGECALPLTLIAHRGRLVLRVACLQPGRSEFESAVALFAAALKAVLEINHL